MAELADALDLGSSGRPCRFKSCYPQSKIPYLRETAYLQDFLVLVEYNIYATQIKELYDGTDGPRLKLIIPSKDF